MVISSQFKYMQSVFLVLMMFTGAAHAISSTNPRVMPTIGASQSYQAKVDENECITLKSSPYAMAVGTGGTNMSMECPKEYPVMYQFQQQLGFFANTGGGNVWIRCCALAHSWQPVSQGTNPQELNNNLGK